MAGEPNETRPDIESSLPQSDERTSETIEETLQIPLPSANRQSSGELQEGDVAHIVIDETMVVGGSATSEATVLGNFGGYEILSEIARGGMGVVYKARQLNANRPVALKMIRGGDLASAEDVKRFQVEAAASAQLNHPNIVPIYEVGKHDGQHFFSMEFVDGDSLSAVLREGPLAPKTAGQLMLQVARAVGYAHQQGVIHRDIKPGNILIDREQRPRVTDFGLAKCIDADEDLTTTGQVLGTPSYMPPEQAAGKTSQIGPPADVYSLGAVLYCCLIGRAPFQADNVVDTLLQVIHREPVSPRSLNDKIDRDLETICLKCLAKDPSRRYADATELAADLERWENGEPIRARRASPAERCAKWVRRRPALAALSVTSFVAALALAGALVAAFYNTRLQSSLDQTRLAQRLTERARSKTAVALDEAKEASRNAVRADYYRRVAMVELALHHGDMFKTSRMLYGAPEQHRGWEWYYLQRRRHPEEFLLNGPSSTRILAYSPDGNRLLTVAGTQNRGGAELWDLTTRRRLSKYQISGTGASTVREDCAQIAVADRAGVVWIHDAMTADVLHRIDPVDPSREAVHLLRFLPNANQLVVVSLLNEGVSHVRLWDIATRVVTCEYRVDWPCYAGCVSSDGERIAVGGGKPFGRTFEGKGKVTVLDVPSMKPHLVVDAHEDIIVGLRFSTTGDLLVATSRDKSAPIWDVEQKQRLHLLVGHTGPVNDAKFSHSGSMLATVSDDTTVRLWSAQTGDEIDCLRSHGRPVKCVDFSPDDSQLVSAGYERYIKFWDLEKQRRPASLVDDAGPIQCVAFSPDGKQLGYAAGVNGEIRICSAQSGETLTKINADPKGQTGHQAGVMWLGFLNNGTILASVAWDQTVRLWDAAEGVLLASMTGPHRGGLRSGDVSPDGRWLASAGSDETIAIWDIESKRIAHQLPNPEGNIYQVAFSPNGRRLATVGRSKTPGLGAVQIWDWQSEKLIRHVDENLDTVKCVELSADGELLFIGTVGSKIHILDAHSLEEIALVGSHRNSVEALAISPDGKRFASGSVDQTIKIWDTETWEEAITLRGHLSVVNSLAFSPDGNRLVSSSFDQTIRIWDATPIDTKALVGSPLTIDSEK